MHSFLFHNLFLSPVHGPINLHIYQSLDNFIQQSKKSHYSPDVYWMSDKFFPAVLLDFKGERDPLQQNGQSQFWFIVSETSCNFLVEFVSSFSFEMKSVHCKVHSIILLTTSIWDVVSTNGSMGHWKLHFMDAATTTFQLWVIFWVIFHYRHCFVSFFINQTTKIKNQS